MTGRCGRMLQRLGVPARDQGKTKWRVALVTSGLVSAFVATGIAETRSVNVDGMAVEVMSEPAQPVTGSTTLYAVRVIDAAGKPLNGLKITLLGRMADGMSVIAPLRAGGEAGVYRGEVLFTMEGQWELTVRVVGQGRPVEVPFTERVRR